MEIDVMVKDTGKDLVQATSKEINRVPWACFLWNFLLSQNID